MIFKINTFLLMLFLLTSCSAGFGKLEIVANMSSSLTEVSAIESIPNSKLIWVIEDAGNKNHLYGLNAQGTIIKEIIINNAKNVDWEDLTSDSFGNLYIGDFGNNKGKRDTFTIYKMVDPESKSTHSDAEIITFKLPNGIKSQDFESFFLFNDYFYLFSKNKKKSILIKVPNQIGNHTAKLVTEFSLDGKNTKVTSADISNDGKTVVLLNHDKLWKLAHFETDQFFGGTKEVMPFEHNSQKEGICFKNNTSVYITDEKKSKQGNNIYVFNLN
jgi:hypothetical protein